MTDKYGSNNNLRVRPFTFKCLSYSLSYHFKYAITDFPNSKHKSKLACLSVKTLINSLTFDFTGFQETYVGSSHMTCYVKSNENVHW